MSEPLFSDTVDQRDDPFSGAQYTSAGPNDSAPRVCKFDGCRNPIEWEGGAGRPPVYCPEHRNRKGSTGPKATTTSPKTGAVTPINSATVAKKIENSLNAMGGMTALLLAARKDHQDAITITTKMPPFAAAMGAWGAESSAIAKMVSGGASVFASITVAFTLFDLVWELLANHGMVPSTKHRAPVTEVPAPVNLNERAA